MHPAGSFAKSAQAEGTVFGKHSVEPEFHVTAWHSAPRLAEWLDALCILLITLLLLAISSGWFTAQCVVLWGSTVPDTDLAFFEKSTRLLGSWWKARVRVRVGVFPDC